ncbi:transmembrane 9 superfamily member 2-like [Apodemus sylvaticus]|uniref:transmembrane 9 superfamily member 2-like n=1 Tax=Apodemus sylvaticus TaxID=10129 RepID=UPI002243460F|nr:transmembrane 9 superfamily member 2-like [Apodemus sylvaticus]
MGDISHVKRNLWRLRLLVPETLFKMGFRGRDCDMETKLCPGLYWLKCQLLLFFLVTTCEAFFFPGLVPITYCEEGHSNSYCKSSIQVYADKLYSVETVMFYDYDSFDFCQDSLKRTPSETLGQILSGEQVTSCPYKFSFKKEETCRKVCVKSYDPDNEDEMNKLAFLKRAIKQNYHHHWVIDNTGIIWCYDTEDKEHHCVSGFPIGCFNVPSDEVRGSCLINPEFNKNNSLYLFNHLDITITYHVESDTSKVAKLISSRIDPKSYKHSDEDHLTCNEPPMEIPEEDTEILTVVYTYSVKFEESKATEWSSEEDNDLETTTEANLQWIRLVNSFFVVLSLCGAMIILILRSICRDIAKYNRIKISLYDRRQFGWRLIHGSVFRLPEHGMLLSILLGQGTQVFIMTFLSLFLAGLGFLTPADPNVLVSYGVVLWLLLEIPAGYVSAKMYKTFKGVNWKMHFLLTTLLFPGIVFADIFIMNLILWMEGSSAAISFRTLANLFALCFGVSTPLTFLGVYFGKKEEFAFPVQTQQTPGVGPQRAFFTKSMITIILGSLLPFGCIFLQLSYILNRIWSPHMYYLFAFFLLLFLIFMISCSEVTVLLCYFRLCAEDCGWWWRAFLTSSFTSVYIFIYALHYYFTKLQVSTIGSAFMYFGYAFILVLAFFLFTGTIGFFSCFFFVTALYGVMKVD